METQPTRSKPGASEPTADVVEQAAGWLAHLESGDASDADVAQYEAWRIAHPTHRIAIDRLSGLHAQDHSDAAIEREALRRLFLQPRRKAGGALICVAALVGAGWFASTLPVVQLHFADQRTAAGEVRKVPFSDGSRITLATSSAANVVDRNTRRSIRLLRGELLAEVAKPRRVPFVVETVDGTAEAMGTAFTVRKDGDATLVTVVSSHVRACPTNADADQCLTLGAGERARLKPGSSTRLADVTPADAAAWVDGWLPVDNRPLVEVLGELNRWRSTPIRFDRAALSNLRVSGIFPLRDTDRAIENLARSQPITIDRSDPKSPAISRRSE